MFRDPADFPIARALESGWRSIQTELRSLEPEAFHPWPQDGSYAGSWDLYPLLCPGLGFERNRARCPETARILQADPAVVMGAFSRLAPGTEIGVHSGTLSLLLRLHLGLDGVGDACGLRFVSGGTEGRYIGDKPHWSPDGKTIYFVSPREGFMNVWGRRFDPVRGKPVGQPFQVTAVASPNRMMPLDLLSADISVSEDRLVLPITEVTGNLWMLENVDR